MVRKFILESYFFIPYFTNCHLWFLKSVHKNQLKVPKILSSKIYLNIINNIFLFVNQFDIWLWWRSCCLCINFFKFCGLITISFIWFDFSSYLIIINNIFLLVNQFDIWLFWSFRWRKNYWLYINILDTRATDVATVFDDRRIIYRPLSSSCKKREKNIV